MSNQPKPGNPDLLIRPIATADAEAAANLSGELGYPVSTTVMEERIRNLASLRDHAVFVACVAHPVSGCSVVGWIDVGIVHHLQGEPYGEIGGLVVAGDLRGSGVGRRLVACAEQFTRQRGIGKMLVRSQIAREAAHRFYLREGYERTKTSAVFSKTL